MRQVRRPPIDTAPKARTETYPAPVRGLNYRESLAAMKPTDALVLDNIICRAGFLEVRKGRTTMATGLPAVPQTLFPYSATAGAQKLFAAAGAGIYDVTSAGAVGAAVVTGLTSSYWNQTQVSNTGGNYLIAVNGQDAGQIYDGSTWAALGFTGLATTSMTQVGVFKRRVWVVEKNSFNAWYGGTDAITGVLTAFLFAGMFKRGGRLQAILNWTIDGGSGSDDYLLAVTSMGEVAVYRGTDPSAAATFAHIGTYFVGPPVGERFWCQYGGDVLMMTAEGLFPFSKYLQSQTVNKSTALTDRIQQLISADISAYGSTQGWEIHVFFDDNFLLLQVPAGAEAVRYQYAMSTITGAWSRFIIPSTTWMVRNNTLFMGSGTSTYNAWNSGADVGEPIQAIIVPAFSYFGSPTRQKMFGMGRLLIKSDNPPQFLTKLLRDFDLSYYFPTLAANPPAGNLWDVAIWDATLWGTVATYSRNWYSLAGLGYAATQAIYLISYGTTTQLVTIDYTFQSGGVL